MKTANAMQLKARIKARAKAANVSPQLMLQDYLLERLLERLSLSMWRERFIVKGGMLIGSLIGVESRVTKDLDTTIRGFALTRETAETAFREICAVEVDDDISFEFVRTEVIRETDDYPGIRVFVKANYEPMSVPLSIDVTAGDAITPDAIEYDYLLMFDERAISVMTYPVETVMAEKLETIVTRGVANTRPRDYYDACKLWLTRSQQIDVALLAKALEATCAKRGSTDAISRYGEVLEEVMADERMLGRWNGYARDYSYARDVAFEQCCEIVRHVMDLISTSAWAAGPPSARQTPI